MKIDDLKKEDLYGDWNLTLKKTFDCAKSDLKDMHAAPSGSGPVTRMPSGPKWLEGLKTAFTVVAIIALLLGLLSPTFHVCWIATAILGTFALTIHLIQRHITRT